MKNIKEKTTMFIKADDEKVSRNKMVMTWLFLTTIYVSGLQWILCDLVSMPKTYEIKLQLMAIAIWLVSFIFTRIPNKKERYFALFYLIAAVVSLILCGIQKAGIVILDIINYAISRWNIAHDDGVVLFSAAGADNTDILRVIIIISFMIYFSFFLGLNNILKNSEKKILSVEDIKLRRGKSQIIIVSTVLSLAMCILSVLIQHTSWFGMTLLLMGQMGIYMYRFSDRIYLRMYVWYLSGLVLMCCISLFYEGQSSSLTRNTRELVKQEAEDLRYGKNILPEGDLYKCHKLSVSDKKVLDVDTELVKDIYLYGYTGADYENGKWQPLKKSAYGGENSGMTEWLQKNNFAVNNILGTYNSISLKKKKTNSIKIKNIGTDRERLYTTLETVKISGSGYNADKDNGYHASGLRGAKSYSLDEMSSGLPGEMLSVKKWVQEPQNEQQKKYMSSEKIYRNFVYDNYLGVNKELSEYIQKNYVKKAKKSDKTGVYSITRYIRENLKEKTVYDKAPQAYKSGEEPIELFMTGEKAGNSALYASAAVEIFRAFGIPARYAEGFLLKKADIQKAETGNITLTGKNAHAWVQVYMDAAGWVDIDVTPGFYYEERELMHMVDSPEGMQLTAEVRKNTGNSGKKYSGMKKEDKNKNVFSFIVVLKIFVSLLMAVVILFILYLGIKELSKIVRYKKYKIKLKNAAEPQKGWIMYSMLISLLEDVGIDVRLGWRTKETQTRIKKECPSVDDDEFENVAAILEKNIYGEKKLELWEVNQVGEFVDKIYYDVTGIMRKMSFTRK